MLNTKKLIYILPDVAYIAELLPTKKQNTFSIQSFRQINGEFLDDNKLIADHITKLVEKIEPEEYSLILPDFLFTNTIVEVDQTSETKVNQHLKEQLLPELLLTKDTHDIETNILTTHNKKSKVQISALEKSVLADFRTRALSKKINIIQVMPLSWVIKSVISLEPSISVVQMGEYLYLAQHYIGVDQTISFKTDQVANIAETIKTLKGTEPNIQTVYLLTDSSVEDELKKLLADTVPLQQLTANNGKKELPDHIKQIIETSIKTIEEDSFPIPQFPLGKVSAEDKNEAEDKKDKADQEDKDKENQEEQKAEPTETDEATTETLPKPSSPAPTSETDDEPEADTTDEVVTEVDETTIPKIAETAAAKTAVTTATSVTKLTSPDEATDDSDSDSNSDLDSGDQSQIETTEDKDTDTPAEPEKSKEDEQDQHQTEQSVSKKSEKVVESESEVPLEQFTAQALTKPMSTEISSSRPVIKNKSGNGGMLKMIFITIAVVFITVGIGVGLGLSFLSWSNRNNNDIDATPIVQVEESPQPSPSPSPSPSPELEADKSELSILVVNATTKVGYAGKIKQALLDAEFKNVDTGNAKGEYEDGLYVLMKEENQAVIDLLAEASDLTFTYQSGIDEEDPKEEYDIVVVLAE